MNFWWNTTQFILCTIFTMNFTYFALASAQRDAELGHKTHCIAISDVNHPIHVTKDTNMEDTVNVSRQYHVLFFTGLIINILHAVYAVFACFLSQSKKAFNAAMQVMFIVVNTLFLICCTYVRFSHAGRVCGGDYLYYPISIETRENGVLGVESQFITVFIVAQWISFIIMLTIMGF